MKKYFAFLLALVLGIFFLMPIATADDTEPILHYAVTNNTANTAITYVGSGTFTKGKHRIIGFKVYPVTPGSGTVVGGLYDATEAGEITDANLMGEDAAANTTSAGYNFPRPVRITDGIAVSQGANTTVVIYYEQWIG